MNTLDSTIDIENCALRLLAQRDHTRRELMRKLMQRGFVEMAIQPVLNQLEAQGFINESRFAEHYAAERANKGFGVLRIRSELHERGLSATLIEQALEPMKNDWAELLTAAYHRRFNDALPTNRADYGRRARFLEQRGFPTNLIRRFLRWSD
ncbi:RecX family transcriptional regulator [Chromatium weissei]|nr:RecX family transcriptional regulator [Chromatium weissei]